MKAKFSQMAVLTLILLIKVTASNCQNKSPSKIKDYQPLNEKIHFLTLFVNTNTAEWESDEIEIQYAELLNSQRWIQNEAIKWNQQLAFDNEYFFLDNKTIVHLEPIHLKSNPRVIIQKIMNDLGFNSFQDYLKENEFNPIKEKLKLVIFVKNAIKNHDYNPWSTKDMDLAIIYNSQQFFAPTDQYAISKEILYLFGAWNLYYEKGEIQTLESSKKAKKLYPNSIMLDTKKNKDRLTIDEVTAWRIGWNSWKASFSEFDPYLNQEKIKEEDLNITPNNKGHNRTLNNNAKSGH